MALLRRDIPIILRRGVPYLTKAGKVVTLKDNGVDPEFYGEYRFYGDNNLYYRTNGMPYFEHQSSDDIVGLAILPEHRYKLRNGRVVEIARIDRPSYEFPIETTDYLTYTRDGFCYMYTTTELDIVDYVGVAYAIHPSFTTPKLHKREAYAPVYYNTLTNWNAGVEIHTQRKLDSGDYRPVPEGFPVKWGTGVHMSTTTKDMLAYFPTKRHYERGVPQQIKPGRYVRQFFDYSDDEVRRLAALCSSGELRFFSKWQDMLGVYVELDESGVVSSCMSKDSWGVMHPLMVYDNSDVELAVLYSGDKPVARALYNKNTREYPMVYGQWEKMEIALTNAGFEHGSLDGARIRRLPARVKSSVTRDNLDLDNVIQYDEDSDCVLMPYIDDHRDLDRSSAQCTNVDIYEDYCVIDSSASGEYEANRHEEGFIDLTGGKVTCDHCGDRVHPDDTYYVEGSDIYICECCWTNDTVQVMRGSYRNQYSATFLINDLPYHVVEISDIYYYDSEVAYDYGYRFSDYDDEWYHVDDVVWVESENDWFNVDDIGSVILYDDVTEEYLLKKDYEELMAERAKADEEEVESEHE